MIQRKKFYLPILCTSLALVACLIGCVSKPATKTTSTSDYGPQISTLETRVAQQSEQIANLQSLANKQTTTVDYSTPIKSLQTDVAALSTKVDALSSASLPRYAWPVSIGRRYVEISVSGAGDYPIIVTLYGTNLVTGQVVEGNDRNYQIADEYLYGTYSLVAGTATIPVPSQTITIPSSTVTINGTSVTIPEHVYSTSGAVVGPTDPAPNAHTHTVDIPSTNISVPGQSITLPAQSGTSSAQSIVVPTYSMALAGTQLVLVIEPDQAWAASDKIELDIRDVTGDITYVSAIAGTGE